MIEKLHGYIGSLMDDKDSREVLDAYERFYKAFGEPTVGEKDEALGGLALALERQGFVCGFRFAVALMTDRA